MYTEITENNTQKIKSKLALNASYRCLYCLAKNSCVGSYLKLLLL